MGEEAASVTTYERDDGGRLVAAVTTRQPRWSDEDRAAVFAYLEEDADTCPGCGHPMSECRDRSTAGTWQVITEKCQPGAVAQAVAKDMADERGLHIYTKRTTGADT